MRASALLNSEVVEHYPRLIEAGRDRDWAWPAHGRNNSVLQAEIVAADERAYLADVLDTIERGTGKRPRGWMGPALSESFRTPELLRELGVDYVLD
ncbi:hypothetical protein [Nocardia sp. NPDC002869]|uniref:hypothetical protein n=1 Tax=Nocardia sp. NPDC002869 TaxID=3161032 RepID=UPI00398CC8F6